MKPGGLKIDRQSHQELAAYKFMISTQGLTSFLYQTFLWNPLRLPSTYGRNAKDLYKFIQSKQYKGGFFSNQLRNMAVTDVMKWVTFLPAMLTRHAIFGSFMGDDEDNEEREAFFSHFLQMFPYAGFGVTWSWDTFIAFIALMMDEEDLFVKKAKKSMVLPRGNPEIFGLGTVSRFLNKGRESLARAFWDYND